MTTTEIKEKELPKITPTDYKIIGVLQENSRLSCREIAKQVGVSAVTVLKRMNFLENEEVIKKYRVWVDYEKLGYDICAIIQLKLAKDRANVVKRIAQLSNATRVYVVTGPFDVLVVAKFRTRRELNQFVSVIRVYEGVERTETVLVFSDIKEDSIKFN